MTYHQLERVHTLQKLAEEATRTTDHSFHVNTQMTPSGYRFIYINVFQRNHPPKKPAIKSWTAAILPDGRESHDTDALPLSMIQQSLSEWVAAHRKEQAA